MPPTVPSKSPDQPHNGPNASGLPVVHGHVIASKTSDGHWYRQAFVHNCPGCTGTHAHRVDWGVRSTIRVAHCHKVVYVLKVPSS